jgi:hypothetical protein
MAYSIFVWNFSTDCARLANSHRKITFHALKNFFNV